MKSIDWHWLGWVLLLFYTGCKPIPTPAPTPFPTVRPTTIRPTATPRATATLTPTPTQRPTATPSPTPTPILSQQLIKGITAQRVGMGAFPVLIVGENAPIVAELYVEFNKNVDRLPPDLSLWFINEINPKKQPNFLFDADSSMDGCLSNEGIGRPFTSAESRALQQFALRSALTIFYQTASTNRLIADSCEQNGGVQRIVDVLAQSLEDGISRPSQAGHFVDYLVGEGVPALAVESAEFDLSQQKQALDEIFADLPQLLAGKIAHQWLDPAKMATWAWTHDSLIHPLAIEQVGETIYLIDSGRLLAVDRADPNPTVMLQKGKMIEEVMVQELLDIATDGKKLWALDRAGDVYRFESGSWTVERYDRPIRERSSHYYVALAAETDRFLLESSSPLLLRYDESDHATLLENDTYPIDLSVAGEESYVLMQEIDGTLGKMVRYRPTNAPLGLTFVPKLSQPRQLVVTADQLWVLDQRGSRLLRFGKEGGTAEMIYRFTDHRPISAMTLDPNGKLLLAVEDALYFVEEEKFPTQSLDTADLTIVMPPQSEELLRTLVDFAPPLGAPRFNQPDYQLPGAPRHYRLGIHEGIDFYWQRGTMITAAAAGRIIKADWEYQTPSDEQFAYWRSESRRLSYTPPEGERFFHGRQLWIDHGNGVVSRYAHLSEIESGIDVGSWVEQGEVIGYVGNSGSPGSLEGEEVDAHLHFELWLGDGYLGQYLRPIEIREWIRAILR